MRQRLLADREALLAASAASAGSRQPVGLDQASVGRLSRVDAMQQQATALAAERRRASALARMDAALSRLRRNRVMRMRAVLAAGRSSRGR